MTPSDYAHSLQQATVMDVYGIEYQGWGWYVKIYIDENLEGGETTVVSFHLPEHDLKTRSRIITKGGIL